MVSPFLKQCWMVSGVLINIVAQGMMLTYPSSLLPALFAPDSPIEIDLSTASWLASSVGMAAPVGFIGTSILMEIYGRKPTHFFMILPALLGWLLIYFAKSASTLVIGRLCTGITGGATVTLGAVIIGEFTSPNHRGMFLNLKTAATCLGSMILHIAGHYTNWRTVCLISLIPLTIALFNILCWPESPSWLAAKNRFSESEKAFYWLRGKSDESIKEFEALIKAQNEKFSKAQPKSSLRDEFLILLKKFTRRDFVQPVMIIFFSFIIIEACGRHTFPAFALDIIKDVSGDTSNTFLYTICMDIIVTFSIIFGCVLVKMFRRRSLLFFSCVSSIVVLLSVSVYLYLVSTNTISKEKSWIPLTMLVAYFILSNLGCTSIPLALLGEVFPLRHRSAGTAISGVAISLNLTVALQVTPILMAKINSYGTFTVYCVVMFVALVILYFILPETKDRTLQEIEDYFNEGKFSDRRNKKEADKESTKMLSYKV